MANLPGQLWFQLRRRQARRHKRILSAERRFHEILLDVKPGDICIDCGANKGDYTAYLARTGAIVHAFEPDPLAHAVLEERFGGVENVVIHQAAVGVTNGALPFYRKSDTNDGNLCSTVSSSLSPESSALKDCERIEVEIINFLEFLDGLEKQPAVVKVDIEGAEVELLEQLIESGRVQKIQHLFVETHEKQMPSLRRRTFALIHKAGHGDLSHVNLDWS